MSFNIALSGLNAAQKDLDVSSNNIANVNTVGFKESRAEFVDVYASSLLAAGKTKVGDGVITADVAQQFSQGSIQFTNNASQLLGHEEVQNLLDMLAKTYPKLVEGFIPETLSLGTVVKVLQSLMNEGVAVRDMRSIVQTLVEYGPKSQDAEVLTAAVRISLRKFIIQDLVDSAVEVPVITLAPELEQMLHQSMQMAGDDGAGIEPGLAERLQKSLTDGAQQQEMSGDTPILLTSGILRTVLAKFVKYTIPSLRVISYQEIPDDKQIKIVSAIGQ